MPALLGPGVPEESAISAQEPPGCVWAGRGERQCPELCLFQGAKWCEYVIYTERAKQVTRSAWTGQEDFLEEAVCDRAWKNRAAEGRGPRWEEL